MRKLGQLNDALDLVQALLAKESNNLYNRRAAAWVYLELIKTQCNTVNDLNKYLPLIINLALDSNEVIFWEQLSWQMAKFFFGLNNSTTVQDWMVFCDLWSMIPHNVSLGNSTLLKAILKHQTEIPPLVFCKTFSNFNSFQAKDFQPEVMANGKSMLTLVERVFIAIAKNWSIVIENRSTLDITNEVNQFLEKLDILSESQPKMIYLIYYRAIIRLNLGRVEEAKNIFIPFAQKKQADFWVWELFSQLYPNDTDMQISCLAKALLCKTSPDFLVKVRQKMVELLIIKQDWNAASTEIENIIVTRTLNNWQIPAQINIWLSKPEIANAYKYTTIEMLYRKYSLKAENILRNVTIFKGIIWKINPDKKTAQFFVDEKKFGGFNYERLKVDAEVGLFIELSLVEIKDADNPFWQVQIAKKSNGVVPEHLEKHFNGVLKKVGNSGFVDNIFIEQSLLTTTDGLISGRAIRAYDSKKQNWGWKAISLDTL